MNNAQPLGQFFTNRLNTRLVFFWVTMIGLSLAIAGCKPDTGERIRAAQCQEAATLGVANYLFCLEDDDYHLATTFLTHHVQTYIGHHLFAAASADMQPTARLRNRAWTVSPLQLRQWSRHDFSVPFEEGVYAIVGRLTSGVSGGHELTNEQTEWPMSSGDAPFNLAVSLLASGGASAALRTACSGLYKGPNGWACRGKFFVHITRRFSDANSKIGNSLRYEILAFDADNQPYREVPDLSWRWRNDLLPMARAEQDAFMEELRKHKHAREFTP